MCSNITYAERLLFSQQYQELDRITPGNTKGPSLVQSRCMKRISIFKATGINFIVFPRGGRALVATKSGNEANP